MDPRRGGVALVVALAAALLLHAGVAAAQERAQETSGEQSREQDAAELGLEVVTGYEGVVVGPRWMPVEVHLQPARLVAGTLTVTTRASSGRAVERIPIEVSAGSRKVFRLLMPTGPISVQVEEAGRDRVVAARARARTGTGSWSAGYLGDLPPSPPPLRHDPTGESGTWAGIDPAWVEIAPEALEPVGTLVATRGALSALTDAGRSHVAAAVAAGTDLVVVADAAGPLDLAGLGLPWEPATEAGSADGVATVVPAPGAWVLTHADVRDGGPDVPLAAALLAGRGRIAVVAVAPGDGPVGSAPRLWSALTGPSPRADVPLYEGAIETNPWLLGRVLHAEGSGPPRLPWLAAFMLVYVVVVGPVNALVLRRFGRNELGWVTVPIVSVVFTVASFAGAVGQRPPQGIVGSVAYWIDGVAGEAVAAGGRAPTPGEHTIEIQGEGWMVRPVSEGASDAVTTARASGTTVTFDLPALQLGGVIAHRVASAPPPLELVVVAARDNTTATITNVGTEALSDITVRSATVQRRAGDLEPGASATVTLSGRLGDLAGFGDPMADLPVGPTGQPVLPDTLQTLLRERGMDGAPGLVWAVGTVDGQGHPALVDGRTPLDRGSLVAVAVRPQAESGEVTPHMVARDLVHADRDAYRNDPQAIEGPGAAVLRYRLPGGARPDRLHEDLRRPGRFNPPTVDLAVWDRSVGAWIPVGEAFRDDGADPARVVSPLGEVYVRASGELFPFEFASRSVSGVPAVER